MDIKPQKKLSAPTAGLGQHEPPRLVLEVGDSNFLGGNARKAEVPPLETLKWGGGTSAFQAAMPGKLKSGGFELVQPSCRCLQGGFHFMRNF